METLKNIAISLVVLLAGAFMAGIPVFDMFSIFSFSSPAVPKRQVRAYNAPVSKSLARESDAYVPPKTASAAQSSGTELRVFDSNASGQDAFGNNGISINAATASRDLLQNAANVQAVQNMLQQPGGPPTDPTVMLSGQVASGNAPSAGGSKDELKFFSSNRSPGAFAASGVAVGKQQTSEDMYAHFDENSVKAAMVGGPQGGAELSGEGAGETGGGLGGIGGGNIGGGNIGGGMGGGNMGGGGFASAFGTGGGGMGDANPAAFDMNNPSTVAAMASAPSPQAAAVSAVVEQFSAPDRVAGVGNIQLDKVQSTITKIEKAETVANIAEEGRVEEAKRVEEEKVKEKEVTELAAAEKKADTKPKGRAYYEKQDRLFGDENEDATYDRSLQFDGFKL